MKLRTRIVLAGIPLIAVLCGVFVFSARTMDDLGGIATRIVRENDRSLLAAQSMEDALFALDRALVAAPATASLAPHVARFSRELAVQAGNITEPGEVEATEALKSSFEKWRDAVLALENAPGDRLIAFRERVLPLEDELRASTQRILEINRAAMTRKAALAEREAADVSRSLTVASVLAFALACAVGFGLAHRIARPLVRLASAARKVGEGELVVGLDDVRGDEEVQLLVGEFRSMTDKLRAYRESSLGELIEATETAQAAIDSLADPVFIFDARGEYERSNEAARTLLGVDQAKGDDADPLASVSPELRGAIDRVRKLVLQGKGTQAPRGLADAVPILVAEQPRYVSVTATAIYAPAGSIVGVTVLVRDVTTLRRADEIKSDLLSAVAHELRTPLTSIRMTLHLCLEGAVGPLSEKQQELLHSARDDAERLHRILEGILSASKIEAGVLVGRRRPVEPSRLVESALEPLRERARDAGLALSSDVPSLPLVEVDEDAIVLVLRNMLENALKHTPRGGKISVSAKTLDEGVAFSVADTGAGIPEEHRPRLFEKFFRVPGSPPGGTGLGLSIARDIVLAHDGEIGVESELGKGSRFWFRLPKGQKPPLRPDDLAS